MPSILLIVDNDRLSRLILQGFYEYLCPDWQVFHATSGEEALSIASSTKLDLISLELDERGFSGLEVAVALRKIQPDVRIAIWTACQKEALETRARSVGMGFVAKPVTPVSVKEIASLAGEAHGQA